MVGSLHDFCYRLSSILRDSRLSADKTRADRLAAAAGWRSRRFFTSKFSRYGYHNGPVGLSAEMVVYIEGDGQPWITPSRIAADPTPRAPIMLRMAVSVCRRRQGAGVQSVLLDFAPLLAAGSGILGSSLEQGQGRYRRTEAIADRLFRRRHSRHASGGATPRRRRGDHRRRQSGSPCLDGPSRRHAVTRLPQRRRLCPPAPIRSPGPLCRGKGQEGAGFRDPFVFGANG